MLIYFKIFLLFIVLRPLHWSVAFPIICALYVHLQFWLKTPLISDTDHLPRAFFWSWLISFVFCLLFVCSFLLSTLYAIYSYGVFPKSFFPVLFFLLSCSALFFALIYPSLPMVFLPPPQFSPHILQSVISLFFLLCSLYYTILTPLCFPFCSLTLSYIWEMTDDGRREEGKTTAEGIKT